MSFNHHVRMSFFRDNVINSKSKVFSSQESTHMATFTNQPLPPIVTLCLLFIPPGIISFLLLRDVLASIQPSNTISRIIYMALQFLLRPFRDYMQLEDMAEYDPDHPNIIKSPQWKKWFLVATGAIAGIGWGVLAFIVATLLGVNNPEPNVEGKRYLIYGSSISFCWVSRRIMATSSN